METLEIGTLEMNQRYKEGRIDLPDGAEDLPVNTGVILTAGASGSALGTVSDVGTFTLLRQDLTTFELKPRSVEQRIAMAHLLNPDIGIVSLGGRAGTGKSSLALAAGLEMVLERLGQKKVVVFRPLYAVGGQDLGYLPGTEEEKMSPWTAAVHDALESFCSKEVLDEVASRGLVEILPLTHIRASRARFPGGFVPRPRAAGQPAGGPARRDRHRHRQADRLREILAAEPDLTETRMFGGLAFMVAGQIWQSARAAKVASCSGSIRLRPRRWSATPRRAGS